MMDVRREPTGFLGFSRCRAILRLNIEGQKKLESPQTLAMSAEGSSWPGQEWGG